MMHECSPGESACQYCIHASCRPYRVDTLPKGRHDAWMQHWRVDSPGLHSCIMTTNGHNTLKHYAALKWVKPTVHILECLHGVAPIRYTLKQTCSLAPCCPTYLSFYCPWITFDCHPSYKYDIVIECGPKSSCPVLLSSEWVSNGCLMPFRQLRSYSWQEN